MLSAAGVGSARSPLSVRFRSFCLFEEHSEIASAPQEEDFDARYSITAYNNMRALDDDGLIYSKYVETHAYVVIVEPYERDERF